jgi:hypothetical protein
VDLGAGAGRRGARRSRRPAIFLAVSRLPKHPLARTRDRLKLDWMLTREELQ